MQNLHNIGWIHSFSLSFLHSQTINLLIEQSGREFPSSSLLSQLRLYIHLGAGQGICVYVSARVYAGQGLIKPYIIRLLPAIVNNYYEASHKFN